MTPFLAAILLLVQAPALAAELEWDAVVERVDGSPLNAGELIGYRIYQSSKTLVGLTTGQAQADALVTTAFAPATASSHRVQALHAQASNYFFVTALDSSGSESALSELSLNAVLFAQVSTLTLSPASTSVVVGSIVALQAQAFDAGGNELLGAVTAYISADPAVAGVDGLGRITARAPGQALIHAIGHGMDQTVSVTVTPPAIDTTPPTLSIISPEEDITWEGQLALIPEVSDAGGLDRVDWYVDDELLASATEPPYSATWDAAGYPYGLHLVKAVAVDRAGLETSFLRETILAYPAATTRFVSPSSGAVVVGVVPVVIEAASLIGIAHVDLVVDGRAVARQGDYGSRWITSSQTYTFSWDTRSLSTGAHTLDVSVLDVMGRTNFSAAMPVRVRALGAVTSIALTPAKAELQAAATLQLTAVAYDADGNVVADPPLNYFSDDPGTASVSSTGRVTARAKGLARITAASDGVLSAAAEILVDGSTPPQVLISRPKNGSTVRGTVDWIAGVSADAVRAQFRLDGADFGPPDAQSPFATAWNTRDVANGRHTLSVTVWNAQGYQAAASAVVTVDNDVSGPVIAIRSPGADDLVSGEVLVRADVVDSTTIARVQFYLDGDPLGAPDPEAPYEAAWNTLSAAAGAHALSARAWDIFDNESEVGPLPVTVYNAPAELAAAIVSPAAAAVVSGPIEAQVHAQGGSGVARVELWVDGIMISADEVSPYALPWDTLGASDGAHYLRARAYDSSGRLAISPTVTVSVANGPTATVSLAQAPGGIELQSAARRAIARETVFVLKVDLAREPEFKAPAFLQATAAMPSGDKTLSLTQKPGDRGSYYAVVPAGEFSASDFAGLEGAEILVAAGGLTLRAKGRADMVDPDFGAIVEDPSSEAQVVLRPLSLTQEARVRVLPAPADPAGRRAAALQRQNLKLIGAAREIRFESSGTLRSATLTMPFDAAAIPEGRGIADARLAYYNPRTGAWELVDGTQAGGPDLSAEVAHFSLYAPVLLMPSAAAGLRDSYAFPNPAVGEDPHIRASLGRVDSVEIKIFDVSGRLVHGASLQGAPTGISGGDYYYDYVWRGAKASGLYFAVIHGRTGDGALIKARAKFAVVR